MSSSDSILLCWKYDLKLVRIAFQNIFNAKLTVMPLAGLCYFHSTPGKLILLIYYNLMELVYVSSSIYYVVAEYVNSVDLVTLGIKEKMTWETLPYNVPRTCLPLIAITTGRWRTMSSARNDVKTTHIGKPMTCVCH